MNILKNNNLFSFIKNIKNKQSLFPIYTIIYIVLSIAYIIEFIVGHKDLEYFITFELILSMSYFCPLFLSKYENKISLKELLSYEYLASIFYLIFYTYCLFTSETVMTFVYAFPMFFGILASGKMKITRMFMNLCTGIITIFTIFSAITGNITLHNYIDYEIMFACMIISCASLYFSVNEINSKIGYLENLVLTDNLTQIYDRDYIDILKQSGCFDCPETVVALGDVKKFKQYNDTFGHNFGDKVLVHVSSAIKKACAQFENAHPIRIGGDEFVVICKECDAEGLINLAKFFISNDDLLSNDFTKIAVDFGISSHKPTFEEMYREADQEMYAEKRG